ncbi:DNA methyltransferase [Candidatus Woesearchaeota archaeon]|nr:DNA methyltransferase [Candidatus Woesearchaeota archaeon]
MSLKDVNDQNRICDSSWDFRGEDTKSSNHGFHTYPAMMIPQIAQRLIKDWGSKTAVVLDPFMGSGTSLLEAKRHNNFSIAYGVDINPLARLITKVKTTPINDTNLQREANKLLDEIRSEKTEIEFRQKSINKPNYYNIDFWFKSRVIQDLSIIKENIEKIDDDDIQDFFKVVFSETVRNVSNTRNSEFKLYRMSKETLEKYNPNTILFFKKKVQQNIDSMKHFNKERTNTKIKILNEDSRNKTSIPSNSVDLILTSPPYGDSRTTVAYGQFSRLALQWLDFDYETVKQIDNVSLGGKPTKDLKNRLGSETLKTIINLIEAKDQKRARDVLSFYNDFFQCIKEFDRVIRKGGTLCFVVGNRTVKSINIPTDIIISELFQSLGNYEHLKTIVRNIPSKRMPKKNSPTNVKGELVTTMNHEYIVILKKK